MLIMGKLGVRCLVTVLASPFFFCESKTVLKKKFHLKVEPVQGAWRDLQPVRLPAAVSRGSYTSRVSLFPWRLAVTPPTNSLNRSCFVARRSSEPVHTYVYCHAHKREANTQTASMPTVAASL